MATAFGSVLEEGHWAEGALVSLLSSNGAEAFASTRKEDHVSKVDLWCRRPGEGWIPIQLSTDRAAIAREKGIDALHRGVVPSFVDGERLERAVNNPAIASVLVREFWFRVDQVRAAFPLRLVQPQYGHPQRSPALRQGQRYSPR